MTAITGNTYPVKEQLKALGATWNKAQKAWMVDDSKATEARALVATAPEGYVSRSGYGGRRGSAYGSRYTRFSSGAEVFTNRNGRCEDAPCCGCCS